MDTQTQQPSTLIKGLRILDIHDFISDMVLLHKKNKAVSLKVPNRAATSTKLKDNVDGSPMNTLMSIPQKRQFLANFKVIYIRYP